MISYNIRILAIIRELNKWTEKLIGKGIKIKKWADYIHTL